MKKKLVAKSSCQNDKFSEKINCSSSIVLLSKTEHLCFDFRHFANLKTVR